MVKPVLYSEAETWRPTDTTGLERIEESKAPKGKRLTPSSQDFITERCEHFHYSPQRLPRVIFALFIMECHSIISLALLVHSILDFPVYLLTLLVYVSLCLLYLKFSLVFFFFSTSSSSSFSYSSSSSFVVEGQVNSRSSSRNRLTHIDRPENGVSDENHVVLLVHTVLRLQCFRHLIPAHSI
jgi:hypothetical protein